MNDYRVVEDIIMERYGWTKRELDETPVYVIQNALFLIDRRAVFDKKNSGG